MKETKKKIKIGVIVGQLTHLGGVGIAAVNEVRELRKMGVDAELVVLFRQKKFDSRKIFKAEDIPMRFLSDGLPKFSRINFKFPYFSFFSLFHLASIFWAPFLIRKYKYNAILVHETYNCLAAIACAKTSRIELISYVWDPISYILPRVYSARSLRLVFPVLRPFGRFLDKLIVEEAEGTLVCSQVHVSALREIGGRGNINVVYPGCHPKESIAPKRANFIVSLTKWDIGKNPEFLLEVLRRLKNKEAKLVMAGNWVQESLEKQFIKKAEELGLRERVDLSGRADDKMKDRLFSEARVLVHPIFEAFGMFGLEAAACGCPIIVPRGSGVSELLKHGVHGFFPKEGDVKSFVKYIDLLLDNERKAWEMGRAAWEVAKRNTWQNHTQKLIRLINGYR